MMYEYTRRRNLADEYDEFILFFDGFVDTGEQCQVHDGIAS